MIQKRDLYSVYTHTSPTGKVYVGVSNNPKRRWGTYGAPYLYKNKYGNFSQSCFANAIIKYGWDNFNHEILLEKVSFSEALYAEKYLIKWYKTHKMSYNMSDGGEYYSGSRKPLSEKRRLEVKEFMNTHHPMKGRHHTEEAKAKMSEAAKKRNFTEEQKAIIAEKISKANKGKHKNLSEESRRKIILRNKEMYKKGIIKPKGKEVHQYDFNGIYITSYASVSEAARALHGNAGDISSCACEKHLSASGYIWRYNKLECIDVSNFVVVGNKIYTKESLNEKITKEIAKKSKPINQYTLDGEYIATYASLKEARRAGYSGAIAMCCSHKTGYHSANGYRWEYDNVENRKNIAA